MAMLDKIRKQRIEKVKKFKELGINPYPAETQRDTMAGEIVSDFSQMKDKRVTVAGRLMSWREFGKIIFSDLKDGSGEVQLYMKHENMEEIWDQMELYDIGDIVEAIGKVVKTKTGEISVLVEDLSILVKTIRPLPEKWAGLKDEEVRFRNRYLDFLMNPESKEKIELRGKLLRVVREFFWDHGFVEIENPTLETDPAGAEARPFITHLNAYDMDVYLRICMGELWQKMSTVGGFEKVFELGRAYRNEGVDHEHNPEFSMIEFYWAFATIEDNIEFHEEFFAHVAKEITGDTKFEYHGNTIDFTPPIPQAKYNDLFKKYAEIDLEEYDNLEDLMKAAKYSGVELEDKEGWYSTIDKIFKQKVRNQIEDPVFVTHYPYLLTPLAKRFGDDERYVQMSQLITHGMEMCRMYGELNDPIDQMERFKQQQKESEEGVEETWGADYEYVKAMEYGMPPQSGSGIGIDRLIKVLTDAENLREVIAYPIMRPEDDNVSSTAAATGKLSQDFDSVFAKHGVTPSDINIDYTDGNEYLSMSKEFRNEYPTATAGYAIIEGADVSKKNPDLRKLQAEIMKMLQGITKADIESSKNLQSFRNMYSKMGVNWHSRRPSPEALLRRISQGKELYQVNDMVDAYNLVVMTQQVSVGAFDLDQLKKPFELKIADGSERIEVIGGEVKDLDEGEVCYFDNNGPYNLDYNYRDAERSKITKESEQILINTEGVGDIADAEVEKALKLMIAIIQQFCGGKLVEAGLVKASGASQRDVHEVRDEYPYDDKKITVVVADDIEPGIAMNVVGHLTTSVGKNADDIMGRPFYTDKSGEKHIGISRYPVIILKGKKSKIEKLIDQARDENLLVVDYPKEMFETRTDDDLNQALEKKAEEELEYYGVALCGDKDKVEKLTKNFSLYK